MRKRYYVVKKAVYDAIPSVKEEKPHDDEIIIRTDHETLPVDVAKSLSDYCQSLDQLELMLYINQPIPLALFAKGPFTLEELRIFVSQ